MTAGALTLPTGFDVVTVHGKRAYSTQRTAGFVQRRTVADRERRRFLLRWPGMPKGFDVVMRDLYDAAFGVLDIGYTTLDGDSLRIAFDGPPRIVHNSAATVNVEADFVEVL